jgi:hypothetical protein
MRWNIRISGALVGSIMATVMTVQAVMKKAADACPACSAW